VAQKSRVAFFETLEQAEGDNQLEDYLFCRWAVTGLRDCENLSSVDKICVLNHGVSFSDAAPEPAEAELFLGNFPQAVASVHRNVGIIWCSRRNRCGWRDVDWRARQDALRIDDGGVNGRELMPTVAVAQIYLRQLPQRIAVLHDDAAWC
jgi:hypothetical protein